MAFIKPNRHYSNNVQPFATEVTLGDKTSTKYLYVYCITCKPTGQRYVGQRVSDVEPICDWYKGSGFRLKKLKETYEWFENFDVEIIQCCASIDELNVCEKRMIKQCRKQYGKLCVNVMEGGQLKDRRGTHLSDEHKKRMAKTKSEYSPERKEQIRQKHLERWCNMTPEQQKQAIDRLNWKWHDPIEREILLKQRRERMHKEDYRQAVSDMFKDKWANDPDFQEKMRIKNITHSEFMKKRNKEHPELAEPMAAKRRRRVQVLESFVSPINGVCIEESTVFNSVTELCRAIGIETTSGVRRFSYSILNNKDHPGVWNTNKINGKCTGSKRVHVTTFKYLD